MKWYRTIALLLLLVGCAQISDDLGSPKASVPGGASCLDALGDMNALTQPNTYRRKFLACDAPVDENELVRRYVQAIVVTGHFNALHSATLFPSNVNAELASTWTDWIERHL
jgi:hypothetical protein